MKLVEIVAAVALSWLVIASLIVHKERKEEMAKRKAEIQKSISKAIKSKEDTFSMYR